MSALTTDSRDGTGGVRTAVDRTASAATDRNWSDVFGPHQVRTGVDTDSRSNRPRNRWPVE
jgi:hypothetical protein